MSEWILFLPLGFLPIGAIAFAVAWPRVSARAKTWLPILFLVLIILTILPNAAPMAHRVTLSEWKLASFALAFELDGIAFLLLLTSIVVLLALWLVAPPRAPFDLFPTMVLASGALFMVAGNSQTLYLAWVLLDLAMFAWRLGRGIERESALRALALSQLAGLGLFVGASLANTTFSDTGNWVIALAFWARLGLFPFHWILPMRGSDSRDLWLARGMPLLAAASAWTRAGSLQSDLISGWIGVLAALALLAALVWAWSEEQPPRAVAVVTWHSVALIPLASVVGTEAALASALWLTLGTVIALGLFEMALRWRAENKTRWPRLIWIAGMLSLAGLPLTPAFVGRIGLYMTLYRSGQWPLLLIIGVVTSLVLARLWEYGLTLQAPEPRKPARVEYVGLVLIGLAFAALSLAPVLIAGALGPQVDASAQAAFQRLLAPGDPLGLAVCSVILLAPIVVSLSLRSVGSSLHLRLREGIGVAARVLDLGWLASGVTGIGYQMSSIARGLAGIVEENPTVWILLAALWVAIFVLIPR